MPTTKKNNLLEYKGHPLMRKENIIYYGSMSDSHIIMMQILESSDYKGLPVAKRVSVQLLPYSQTRSVPASSEDRP